VIEKSDWGKGLTGLGGGNRGCNWPQGGRVGTRRGDHLTIPTTEDTANKRNSSPAKKEVPSRHGRKEKGPLGNSAKRGWGRCSKNVWERDTWGVNKTGA